MISFISNILKQKKAILILGIVVSLLVLHQSDIYSSDAIRKIEPKYNALKTRINQHRESQSDKGDNLNHANFIATFFSTLSGNESKEKNDREENSMTLKILKIKINEFVSTF